MTVPQKVKEYFRFFEYLNQYSAEGIKFDFYTQTDGSEPIHNSFSISDEGDANLYSTNRKNTLVDIDTIQKFILRRYNDRKILVSEPDFIIEELDYLSGFPKELINDYEYQFKPLKKELENLKKTGINKLIDLQKPEKMSLHISNNSELKKELEAEILRDFKGKISLETTLTELEKTLDRKSVIKKEIEKRMSIAPNKQAVLQTIISDYREQTIPHAKYIEDDYPRYYDYDIYNASDIHNLEGYEPQGMARHLIEKGLNFKLLHFANLLTYQYYNGEDENKIVYNVHPFINVELEKLADGVALAYLLPELEKELQELREPKNQIQTKPETFEDTVNSGGFLIQKMLVLKELGFFELDKYTEIKKQTQQIELFVFLFGQSKYNIKKGLSKIGYDYFGITQDNLEVVNGLFEKIGLEKIDKVPKK